MKTFVVFFSLLLASVLCFAGCSGGNRSEIKAQTLEQPNLEALLEQAGLKDASISWRHRTVIPESRKAEAAEWVTKTVSAASLQLTGGDIEDQEDVVDEVCDRAKEFFGEEVKIGVLYYTPKGLFTQETCGEYNDLTSAQRKVFDFLNK